MADPFTLAGAATIASGAGSLISGIASSGMYKFQSVIAALNAKIAAQNADYASSQGETQAAESGMKTAYQIGATRARQGASNIAVTSGSPTVVVASERQIGNIDQAIIRNNAARVAYGFKVQEVTDTAQSNMYAKAAPLAMMGSLISGAGSVASKWYQGSSVGLTSTGYNG